MHPAELRDTLSTNLSASKLQQVTREGPTRKEARDRAWARHILCVDPPHSLARSNRAAHRTEREPIAPCLRRPAQLEHVSTREPAVEERVKRRCVQHKACAAVCGYKGLRGRAGEECGGGLGVRERERWGHEELGCGVGGGD